MNNELFVQAFYPLTEGSGDKGTLYLILDINNFPYIIYIFRLNIIESVLI